jgi:hypothetical protein
MANSSLALVRCGNSEIGQLMIIIEKPDGDSVLKEKLLGYVAFVKKLRTTED